LGGRFNRERCVHATVNVMPGTASDNSGKSGDVS
jgi:hypothetical protein